MAVLLSTATEVDEDSVFAPTVACCSQSKPSRCRSPVDRGPTCQHRLADRHDSPIIAMCNQKGCVGRPPRRSSWRCPRDRRRLLVDFDPRFALGGLGSIPTPLRIHYNLLLSRDRRR